MSEILLLAAFLAMFWGGLGLIAIGRIGFGLALVLASVVFHISIAKWVFP